MMSETTIERKMTDSFREHLTHNFHVRDCSECHKKKREIVNGILLLAKQQKPQK